MNISTYWISVSGGNHDNDTPDSCCKEDKIADGCGIGQATGYSSIVYGKVRFMSVYLCPFPILIP